MDGLAATVEGIRASQDVRAESLASLEARMDALDSATAPSSSSPPPPALSSPRPVGTEMDGKFGPVIHVKAGLDLTDLLPGELMGYKKDTTLEDVDRAFDIFQAAVANLPHHAQAP